MYPFRRRGHSIGKTGFRFAAKGCPRKGFLLMLYYVIVCRSLTHAQRVSRLLGQWAVSVTLIRTPRELSSRGCGYSVRFAPRYLDQALNCLQTMDRLTDVKLYGRTAAGEYEETADDLF